MSAEIKKGKIKWFDAAKGIGIIEPDEKDEPVLVHHSAIPPEKIDNAVAGTPVRYSVKDDGKVKKATEVELT